MFQSRGLRFNERFVCSPISPSAMEWDKHYSEFFQDPDKSRAAVEFVDIGCGYGGLLGKS